MLDHGLFYEFVPADELDSPRPTRHWLGDVEVGVNYAIVVSTCAGLWAHVVGDTVRFESLDPPLLTFTGRTKYTLSAFGEHLISEEVEGAIARPPPRRGRRSATGTSGRSSAGRWAITSTSSSSSKRPATSPPSAPRSTPTCRAGTPTTWPTGPGGVGLPLPALLVARPGGIDAWMRSKGKLGGQHKVPRMDNSGTLTAEIVAMLRRDGLVEAELPEAF